MRACRLQAGAKRFHLCSSEINRNSAFCRLRKNFKHMKCPRASAHQNEDEYREAAYFMIRDKVPYNPVQPISDEDLKKKQMEYHLKRAKALGFEGEYSKI